MGEVYTYNGTHLTTVRDGSVELTQMADHRAVGSGHFALDDTAGTQAIVGQMDFSVTQSSCSFPLTFRGFVGDPAFGRDSGTERSPDVGASRGIAANVFDLNAMTSFLLIDGADGKRPAETVAERGAWLMASDYVGFADNGRCDFPAGKGMDAADYRGQYAGDVLADMEMAATGYNSHVNDWGSGPELTFRDDNASTDDTCTYRISNVLSDASSVTLNPGKDATLERRYGNVYSKIAYSYAKGTVYRERAATAAAFNGERGGTASNSNVKTSAKASDEGDSMLWQHHTPEDNITLTLDAVTDAQINLILQGMRIQAKFSHFGPEGYDSFTWFRIAERTVTPITADGSLYKLRLRLSPQEAAPPAAAIIQRTFGRAQTGPLVLHFANPLTIGNKLLVIVEDTGSRFPSAPSTTGPLSFFGVDSWTRLNGSDATAVRAKTISGTSYYNGLAAYYGEITATTQDGYLPTNYMAGGAWELSASADPSSATVVAEDDQTTTGDPCVFDAGSLGTVASGEVAMYAAIWQNNVGGAGAETGYSGDFRPLTAVAPGSFTERHYAGSYDSNYGPYSAAYPALTWIGDLDGSGASVEASIEKPRNERFGFDFGTVGWAAIGIKVPPA